MKDYINQNTPRMEKILATSSKTGLSSSAVTARRKKHGKNHILPSSGCVFARFLLFLAKNIPFYLMLSILIVSAFYLPLPTVITVGAVYFAFLVGVFLLFLYRERQNLLLWRAALPLVGVVRNGCVSYVSPEELVVGDLILLTEGSILYCEAHVVSEDD